MIAIERPSTIGELDQEALAALARFDDDLRAVEAATAAQSSVAIDDLVVLRVLARSAFRNAVAAAGSPDDPRWLLLTSSVATFLARAHGVSAGPAAAAAARLRLLASDQSAPSRGAGGS